MTFTPHAFTWLRHALNAPAAFLEIAPLKGATSSSVFVVHFLQQEKLRRAVLRKLDNRVWLREEPDLARHEAAALREAQRTKVAAPQLLALCEDETVFGAPAVLMTHLFGRVELRPANLTDWLDQLAFSLAAIHRHDATHFPYRFSSWLSRDKLAVPHWTAQPQLWQRALEMARGPAPSTREVFLHRDFHPVNVLWQHGKISGVVDWINACRGPAGVDVAHCRTNLAMMFGTQTADGFLKSYRQAAPDFQYHPHWDVESMLDMALPQPEFYRPWNEFGLPVIAPQTLQRRCDVYLQSVMNH